MNSCRIVENYHWHQTKQNRRTTTSWKFKTLQCSETKREIKQSTNKQRISGMSRSDFANKKKSTNKQSEGGHSLISLNKKKKKQSKTKTLSNKQPGGGQGLISARWIRKKQSNNKQKHSQTNNQREVKVWSRLPDYKQQRKTPTNTQSEGGHGLISPNKGGFDDSLWAAAVTLIGSCWHRLIIIFIKEVIIIIITTITRIAMMMMVKLLTALVTLIAFSALQLEMERDGGGIERRRRSWNAACSVRPRTIRDALVQLQGTTECRVMGRGGWLNIDGILGRWPSLL